jgi:FAD/FMN-containing dehydrogenase
MSKNVVNNREGYAYPDQNIMNLFCGIVGASNVLLDENDMQSFLSEPRNLYKAKAACVIKPSSVLEISNILKIANDNNIAIVPQGGNTGLVGGQVPYDKGNEVILSLSRLNKLRAIDISTNSITIEAGMTLDKVQKLADENDRLFPLSLGSEGSCQIGGNLATNAGGTAVIEYGNTRELTLGLEVVLADGKILNGLKSLRKDNTGYDLKNIFIGSEGTLGIITAATMKLFPKPKNIISTFVSLSNLNAAVDLLNFLREETMNKITSFELMPKIGIELVQKHKPNINIPLKDLNDWSALIEFSSNSTLDSARDDLENTLFKAINENYITDCIIAESISQSMDFWRIRHFIVEVQAYEGGSIKHDISIPIAKIPQFINEANNIAESVYPSSRPIPFGHIGDGNIHYNITQPINENTDKFMEKWHDMSSKVHDLVVKLNGSISAEHGIGRMKRDELYERSDSTKNYIMKNIKNALDARGILNPGKVL